ncbi:PTS glucitol/sorbitol transporter subunit IIA [Brevibacillus massiliensis]|jgi:PTS system glucitol/sorbitol-specific IIA component|uniref:PTS glucitol/sorbitol transporter subunit IIA n=1 Tax=Brevibacillus massiliensis TaxID=1118054 RepID=UPI00031538E6|nr:PTS glucitol/sorbitol transporter subunit IIA [Brevibacillus massiliensis]
MQVLFEGKVTKIGGMVPDFIQAATLIIFNNDVPEELHDMAVLHTKSATTETVQTGDVLLIDGQSFQVTSVGDKANETLKDIGHCTIKFDGSTSPELPGIIHVEQKEIPQIQLDTVLKFIRE